MQKMTLAERCQKVEIDYRSLDALMFLTIFAMLTEKLDDAYLEKYGTKGFSGKME